MAEFPMLPMPVIHHESLRSPIEALLSSQTSSSERRQQLQFIRQQLNDWGSLKFVSLDNGLFPAAAVSGETEYTGYDSIWVRDNIHVAHAHWVTGQPEVAVKTVKTLMDYFQRHCDRFSWIIAGQASADDPMNRPHIRFNGQQLTEIDQQWAHAQNDALGYVLWLYCKLALAGAIEPDADDWFLLGRFVAYFDAIRYWTDADSGHWEEARKVEASSIGAVVAGLRQLKTLIDKLKTFSVKNASPASHKLKIFTDKTGETAADQLKTFADQARGLGDPNQLKTFIDQAGGSGEPAELKAPTDGLIGPGEPVELKTLTDEEGGAAANELKTFTVRPAGAGRPVELKTFIDDGGGAAANELKTLTDEEGKSPNLTGIDSWQVERLLRRGQAALEKILPWECRQPEAVWRRYDGALLFLIYPLEVVQSPSMVQQILDDVAGNLQGEYGVKRYLNDSFWAPDYKSKASEAVRTVDVSEDSSWRDAMLIPGGEAQWCIFDPIMSVIYGKRYQHSGDIRDFSQQLLYLGRALGQVTAEDCAVGSCKCPELYYSEAGAYVPNDSTPLLWTQANLAVALAIAEQNLGDRHSN